MSETVARRLRVLCLDDSPQDAEITRATLAGAGYALEMDCVSNGPDYEAALTPGRYDCILLDFTVPGYTTLAALRCAAEIAPDTPCICVSGTIGEEAAADLIRQGATDYVLKDRMSRLPIAVQRALEAREERAARVETEALLERQRGLLAAVIEATTDAVWVKDFDDCVLIANEPAGLLMGIGTTSSGASASAPDEGDREVLRHGEVVTLEETATASDGGERVLLTTRGPLVDASGAIYGSFGIARDITDRKRTEADLVGSNERLERLIHQVATVMGKVVEARDPYTQGHEVGVARLSRLIAEEMGLEADDVAGIELAALLHDVGKLSVPAEILTKPGRLSPIEFAIIRVHPQSGYDILKDVEFAWPIADIILQHHERLDGSGYPNGLTADRISPAARIVAVADVIEAMSSHRPYRPTLGIEAAVSEIRDHPEKYDGDVIAACLRLHERGELSAS